MAPPESRPFVRRDAVGLATKGTLILGGAGLFMSAIQNTLTKQNVGMFGVITRTGGTVGIFGKWVGPFCLGGKAYGKVMIAAMGGSYMFFSNAAANLREKDDHYNAMVGGLVAGAIMGTKCMPFPSLPWVDWVPSLLMRIKSVLFLLSSGPGLG